VSDRLLFAFPPLDPAVWARPARALPFPFTEPSCRLFARARHGLWAGARALGLAAGDEVLVPAYHHGSEVEALERAGLRCVFYAGNRGLEPDADELDALLSERTRALLIIHYLGFPQDAVRWRRWCDAHGRLLLEDAAHAWLACVDGTPAGAFGDLAIFCLYKSFGLPDGGALRLRAPPPEPAGRPRLCALPLALEHAAWLSGRWRWLARAAGRVRRPRPYDPRADFALGTPRAASLATQLALPRAYDAGVAGLRRDHHRRLSVELSHLVHPAFATAPPDSAPLLLPIAVADKARLLAELRAAGIRALDLWSVPHPSLPAHRFPAAAGLRRSLVGLPVHQELRPRDLDSIAAAVRADRPRPAVP
jgi:dTDP-4-amino-4,6-dideoxygalactose transaminase